MKQVEKSGRRVGGFIHSDNKSDELLKVRTRAAKCKQETLNPAGNIKILLSKSDIFLLQMSFF